MSCTKFNLVSGKQKFVQVTDNRENLSKAFSFFYLLSQEFMHWIFFLHLIFEPTAPALVEAAWLLLKIYSLALK